MKYLLLLTLFSCAKMSYIAEQGVGQVALEYNDIDNEDFLADPNQKKTHKEKVRVVEKAKNYFFKYFELEPYPIYDEVKLLDQKAVTYLVIHSPKNEIKAVRTTFPLMGSFPYLGFFSKDSAESYKRDRENENFQTYMRPVYAYSTLNNPYWPFHDNILSSFFYFKNKDLSKLVFHELVHTIIFVGDNVAFNENLAQFISNKMAIEYFNSTPEELKKEQMKSKQDTELNQLVVALAQELNQRYKAEKTNFDKIGPAFIQDVFTARITKKCEELQLKKCWPLKGEWNNARFAAFKTYEAKHNEIEALFKQLNLPLKDFVLLLIKMEKDFDGKSDFISYVKSKV